MTIRKLVIEHFRNITTASLSCSPHLNIFFGDNAAGKTSLLESIYVLSTAKSFRTNQLGALIQETSSAFSVFAHLDVGNSQVPIGISKTANGIRKIRINEQNENSASKLSYYLPTQFIGTNSHRLLLDGPKVRRQFLDWGLFHTNENFYAAWQTFQKTLSQRNASLKSRAPQAELSAWNEPFITLSDTLSRLRKDYLNAFLPYFNEIIDKFLPNIDFNLTYAPGWDENIPLSTLMSRSSYKEYQMGYSLFGPHRADMKVFIHGLPAQERLSQGQQKLFSYALQLAQGVHLQETSQKSTVYLIDDLPSELDSNKRAAVIDVLMCINAQVFISAIEVDHLSTFLSTTDCQLFHVKHGEIIPAEISSAKQVAVTV